MYNIMLTEEDWDMVIESLESFKSSGKMSDLMADLFTDVLLKPKSDATAEERKEWEDRKVERDKKKALREEQQKKLAKEIDILKSKIILMRDFKIDQVESMKN